MTVVNVHHAKTHLSKLLEQALRGEEVVIAKAGKPLVRLTPVQGAVSADELAPRVPGLLAGEFPPGLGEAFLAPTSPEDLASWLDAPAFPDQD